MLKNEREREIINLLKNENGFITVKELCQKLYASESSIRRDLTVLENKGVVKKTYGGAELITNFSNVIAFEKRYHHSVEAKKTIAKKALKLIKDGSIIFLDQSSTSFYLANELLSKNALTVITNNIEILYLLSTSAIKAVSSGGFLSPQNRNCLIGPDAHSIFENTYADIAFFSAKSLSNDGVISDCTREEVALRNSMLKNAAKRIFLCDSKKFNTRSAYKQCTLSDIDFLISESEDAKKFSMYTDTLKIL